MLKIVIQIKEKTKDNVFVGIKQISEKEFNNSTNAEKMTASAVRNAIEAVVFGLKSEDKKEGE